MFEALILMNLIIAAFVPDHEVSALNDGDTFTATREVLEDTTAPVVVRAFVAPFTVGLDLALAPAEFIISGRK